MSNGTKVIKRNGSIEGLDLNKLHLMVEEGQRLAQRYSVLVAKGVERPNRRDQQIPQQAEKRYHQQATHHFAEPGPRTPNVNKARHNGNVQKMKEVRKLHPRGQWRADDRLEGHAGLKTKQPLVPGNQLGIAVGGDQEVSGVAIKRVVHKQDDQEREPIPHDFPVGARESAQVPPGFQARSPTAPKIVHQFLGQQE